MNDIREIAYAAAQKRLCLFTGTGFSKAVTGGAAPNWQGLLERLCDKLDDADKIKKRYSQKMKAILYFSKRPLRSSQ